MTPYYCKNEKLIKIRLGTHIFQNPLSRKNNKKRNVKLSSSRVLAFFLKIFCACGANILTFQGHVEFSNLASLNLKNPRNLGWGGV